MSQATPKKTAVCVKACLYGFFKRLVALLFICLILFAVFIQLTREAFPLLDDYYQQISIILSEKLDADIQVDSVQATWSGLTPKLVLNGVTVHKNALRVFEAEQASVQVNIFSSLLDWRIAWQDIQFNQLKATLLQNQKGEWQLQGISRASKKNNRFHIDDPFDIFLFGRRIHIRDINIDMVFRSGETTHISLPQLELENDRDFHRLKAAIDIDDTRTFQLMVEGVGDPRDKENFHAQGYLTLNDFSTKNVFSVLGLDKFIPVPESKNTLSTDHKMSMYARFEGNLTRSFTMQGRFDANGIPAKITPNSQLPDAISSSFAGEWQAESGLNVYFDNVEIAYQDVKAPSLPLLLYKKTGANLGVKTPSIHVDDWLRFLEPLNLLGDIKVAKEAVTTLAPKGELKYVDIQFTNKERGWFLFKALMQNGQVEAWRGVPQVRNANGYVQGSLLGGFVNVDNPEPFSLYLPQVYNAPMQFQHGRGQVAWHLDFDTRFVHISSGLLNVTAENETATGYFNLALPFARKYGEGQMALLIGVSKSVAASHKKYIPNIIPQNLYQWLDTSILGGDLTDVGFMYHGSLRKTTLTPPAIQVYGRIEQGELRFNDQWPPLKNISAQLSVDDRDLTIDVDKATIKNNQIEQATMRLVDDGGGRALDISGKVSGDAKKALSLLLDSPIKQQIGETFDRWHVSGGMDANIDLRVPITPDASNGYQRINIALDKTNVFIPEANFKLDNVSGQVTFDSDLGFYSDKLNATIWGKPLTASISTVLASTEQTLTAQGQQPNASNIEKPVLGKTVVAFDGVLNIKDIFEWTDRPELIFMRGQSDMSGQLTIPMRKTGEPVSITLQSQLVGATIDLPAPLQKSASDAIDFAVDVRFEPKGIFYTFDVGSELQVKLRQPLQGVDAMGIALGKNTVNTLRDNHFVISGEVEALDAKAWNTVKNTYFDYIDAQSQLNQQKTPTKEDNTPLRIVFDVSVNTLKVSDLAIDDLVITGQSVDNVWDIHLESERVGGWVNVNTLAPLMKVNLDHLYLPASQKEEASSLKGAPQNSLFDGLDVTNQTLMPAYVFIDSVKRGNDDFGQWRFKLNPYDTGMHIEQLVGKVKGLVIKGAKDPDAFTILPLEKYVSAGLNVNNDTSLNLSTKLEGAHLSFDQVKNRSRFNASIYTQEIADMLILWQQPAIMTGEHLTVATDMAWQGAPDQYALSTFDGLASVNIQRGTFIRGASAGENPILRLIGLFNFDTLARRIKLDFSDLSKRGFVYDAITGEFELGNGTLTISKPLVVSATTSKMQLVGDVNLIDETLDTDLIVTLPMGGNLTAAAALAVGLPAAVGIYVVSKVFKKQVDKVSSLTYSVKGAWSDPKLKVKRVFSNKSRSPSSSQ